MGNQAMRIEVSQSIYFKFKPNASNPNIKWTQAQKEAFVREWLRQIPETWDDPNHTTYRGFAISVAFLFDVRAVVGDSQSQAHVMKLRSRNSYRTSAICRNCYASNSDAKFDSNDDQVKNRRGQTAMIHEFGHMIGLPDEYKTSSAHFADKDSVMNVGRELRDRHLRHIVAWAKPHIDDVARGRVIRPGETPEMRLIDRLVSATTPEEEFAAVEEWRDGNGPHEDLEFVVRNRTSREEIAIAEIPFDKVQDLEVEFSSDGTNSTAIWHPKSREALESLFIE
jgi:hypothetical protein